MIGRPSSAARHVTVLMLIDESTPFPLPCSEEINVYSIPHSRMKRLAQMATDKLKDTNYSIASELLTTVKTLSRVFYEFKTHERIENECIMRRLQVTRSRGG